MSRVFIGFGQVPYIGTPFINPIQICNGGSVIPLFFDWNAYGASSNRSSINVKVTLQPPTNRDKLLKQIASVYIDNTNSNVPIYVYCPDTKYSCVAQPNSAGWYPLYTNQQEIWVIGQGFTDGSIPQTQVFVTDLFIPPYTDQEILSTQSLFLASPNITRGTTIYNKNFGIPALGDQTQQAVLGLTVAGGTVPLFGTPRASGFVYLTAIHFSILLIRQPGGGGDFVLNLRVRSTGPAGALYTIPFVGQANNSTFENLIVYSQSGLQVKLDATQSWVFDADNFVTTGQGGLIVHFTTSEF